MKGILKITNDILKAVLIITIKFYRYVVSPMLPRACRYLPTCSDYALEAIKVHGIVQGVMLSFRRILKCHPFGGCGLDPVKKIKKS